MQHTYKELMTEAAEIVEELQFPGGCTSRNGYSREKAFAMRPILLKLMKKAGYMHMTRLNGSELVVWRVA